MKKLAVVLLLSACSGGADAPAGGRPRGPMRFPVEVMPVEAKSVDYSIEAVGNVAAFERLHVVARVAGAVESVRFSEGAAVKAGQTLATIEPERYRLAVQAQAARMARAQAAYDDALAGLKRREQLVESKPDLIPAEEIATFRTRAQVTAAEVAEAKAALQQAELNLRDATPRAPVNGVIETRAVETGQYVQPGTTLATLIQRDPLLLRFKVPVAEATALVHDMAVEFNVRGQTFAAKITHVGQTADPTSRMVDIIADVDDPKEADLRAGSFAVVRVPVGQNAAATVIPETAVRPSERGFLAFVLDGDVVRERVIQLGQRTANGFVEVRGGVQSGDRVVVRGAEALSDGAAVSVKNAPQNGQAPESTLRNGP